MFLAEEAWVTMDPIIEALVSGASDDTIMMMLEEQEDRKGEVGAKDQEEQKTAYRSCIKVKGRPILPPVMTQEVGWVHLIYFLLFSS